MELRSIRAGTIVLAAIAMSALGGNSAARASSYGRTVAALPFTTRAPARSSGLRIMIHYRDEHDPNAKPKTFHELDIELPAGTKIDQRLVAACTASDAELMAQGPAACPQSQVGDGTVTLMTGFPPPADLVLADVTILQGEGELLDVFRSAASSQTLAVDHVKIVGHTLIDKPQAIPGGPPDGRSAPRDVRLRINARTARDGRAYLTTPPTCPTTRHWLAHFTVFYDDGVTDHAVSTAPCSPRKRPIRRCRDDRDRSSRGHCAKHDNDGDD